MSICDYVDVFYGNDAIDLPSPEGIAASWLFIKAQCGNTHPHAVLPFGKLSCGLYTGGYPTGSGDHRPNSCGPVTRFPAKVRGFAHMHQSGTGAIGTYYNYAVTAPVYGKLHSLEDSVEKEEGMPGYYRVMLKESKIRAEFTIDGSTAIHRYHLMDHATISIDFSNDGLNRDFGERFYGIAMDGDVKIDGINGISADVTLHGVRTYFYALCDGDVESVFLWDDYQETKDTSMHRSHTTVRWGGAFSVKGDCVLKVAISHKSMEDARNSAINAMDFDAARMRAAAIWENYLGKIQVKGEESVKRLFYSNLYHSIVKPAAYEEGEYTDFATLWDMYKTQLPLIYTLYKKESCGIIKTIDRLSNQYGKVPIGSLLTDEVHRFDGQASMLSVYTTADAYWRGVISAENVIKCAVKELGTEYEKRISELLESGKYTHVLDITQACHAVCAIAESERNHSDMDVCKQFKAIADRWSEVFDTDTGLLKADGRYYEGDHWNYSFRLQGNMAERIALCGSKDVFVELADCFFGYGKAAVSQCDVPDGAGIIAERALHRFDGANNEHDMESPYVYNYADRHDRTCEVVSSIMKYMFAEGTGGLPGNNDSGALSSWYVWNAMGLFPVSGQNTILIGSPIIENAVLNLSNGRTLEISVSGDGINVQKAIFNGRELENFSLTVQELMTGGRLEMIMCFL